MAKLSLHFLSFTLLFLFGGCLAQLGSQQQFLWQKLQQQQQHRLRAKTDCRIERLTAQEPTRRYDSEAGYAEYWDPNNKQFECAGVAAVRTSIQKNGLFLPHYNNVAQLIYVVQGKGLLGAVIPGCAETFETEMRQQEQGSESQKQFFDRHQKVRQFRQGDVLALPAGITLWLYNNGQEPLVTVSLLDTANEMNQLDLQFRNFFLAGNRNPQQSQGQQQEESQSEGESPINNIFYGFPDKVLADVYNVEPETIRKLKGEQDQRGRIVKAERFNVVLPREGQEEEQEGQQGQGGRNGLEETLCTLRLRENLGRPSRADVYNPRAGRLATLNSQTLPILNYLQLSAVKGVLYRNAIMAPHWNVNAHSVIYITRGSSRLQVVGHSGNLVFDGEVKENQLIIIPQSFVVIKKAGDQGCEWIAFKTNDNAMISPLAGRLSAFRSMPVDVLANAYRVSKQEAQVLKFSRDESTLFSSSSSSMSLEKPKAMEYARDVIETVI
ncbi:11S globulin subunit beta-like [Olea europaea var. sylvestris]|uniref:11S globulin subunit beta-like n=2 Tax=Olea europaea subsp. europaea TaxID=158383 RepID=A0A8S0R997_OLEEU|nr:11S globulin subunit beta-like [Olea europaea var. sylvestris]CAA2975574.1 11S globulin subunit beta-like [Olea europaea subsp. europaea]